MVKVRENDIDIAFKNPYDVQLVTLADVAGKLIFSSTTVSDNIRVIKPNSPGVYLLNVILKDGKETSRKIICAY